MSYTKESAIKEAFKRIKGCRLEPGTVVACESYKFTTTLKSYDGKDAVVETVEGKEMRFPASEIFDPNKIGNIANHLLNVGFWEEGMESIMITL